MANKFYTLNHISSPAHPLNRFFTSWCLSPLVFLLWRLLLAIYFSAVIIITNILRPSVAGTKFSYFTWLTYWGLTLYLIFSTLHTFSYWKNGRAWLESWPRWMQFLHSLFYSTIVVLPWTVTIVYWVVLFDGFSDTYDAWTQISSHGLNSVIALLEIILPRTQPLPWIQLPWFVFIMGGYLGIAYITEATQGFYTYSFLNPDTNGAGITAAYCVGIMAGTAILFCIVKGLIWVRMWITERLLHMTGKLSHKDASAVAPFPRVQKTVSPV